MNFDRSAVSLRHYMEKFPLSNLTGCKTSTFLYISLSKSCDLLGRAIFGPHGHNLSKFGRSLLDDATNIITRLYWAGLVVSDKNIFYVFPI